MKRNRVVFLISALVLLTAAVAAVHLSGRAAPVEGTLRVEKGGNAVELPIAKLELANVRGTVVNGKGESRAIDAPGLLLSAVLEAADVQAETQVTVTADDAYSAAVSAAELSAPDMVYLIQQEDGGMQMVVFGDANSKRNVSDVAMVTVE